MNNPITNRFKCVSTARGLLLVVVLLLSACDGGIFGTGGPDSIDMSASGPTNIPLTDSQVEAADTASGGLEGATDASTGSVDGTARGMPRQV